MTVYMRMTLFNTKTCMDCPLEELVFIYADCDIVFVTVAAKCSEMQIRGNSVSSGA